MSLFDSGIRPAIDDYLAKKSQERRDYGDYWSASSAGYCMRKLMFERLGLPPVQKESDARKQRVFEAGHVFHEWAQRITKEAGLSIAQELELQDEDIMVRGHIDDLVLVDGRLMLYDYKTQHANAFTWQKGRPPSHYHRLQAGTYMYMLRRWFSGGNDFLPRHANGLNGKDITEARILKISKDDLRMDENQILWDGQLEGEVLAYWTTLNKYWAAKRLPSCSCAEREGGFMAKEKYNPFFYQGQPCSLELYKQWRATKVKETV
jgi:hypothetical protein